MINTKAVAKLIKAKRLEIEAIDEMLPESIREKKQKLTGSVKSAAMDIFSELCRDGAAESTGNAKQEEKPHRVDIEF